MRLASIAMVLSLLLPSCKPRQSYDIEKVDALRTRAESLTRSQMEMGFDNWAHGASSNMDSLYQAYADVFTRENIRMVRSAWESEIDSVQKRRLSYFSRYLTTEHVAKQLASLGDRVSNLEAGAKVTVLGKEIAYREVAGMLINEPDQSIRAVLYTSLDPILDSLNRILAEMQESHQRLAVDLGYSSYNAMVEQVRDFSLADLQEIAMRVLRETETEYMSLLREEVSKELRLPLERFYRHDLGALFRSRRFDGYFPATGIMHMVQSTYRGLGIGIDTMQNLFIDAEPRDVKNPRAVCFMPDVPNDIRLSIKPVGGFDDYAALFHEVGHGLHYAFTQEHAFEFKYLGDRAVTETYAFLSEYMLSNQAWLRMNSSMPAPVLKEFVRVRAIQRLYMIRRYCAKFLYELELHAGNPDASRIYAEQLSRAVGYVPHPSDGKRYLTDVDALYYSANYLRAWFLEAQLNAVLSRDYGVNWFENPKAGTFLRSLWAGGDRWNADELARRLGYDAITPDALLEQVRMMVLLSTKPRV